MSLEQEAKGRGIVKQLARQLPHEVHIEFGDCIEAVYPVRMTRGTKSTQFSISEDDLADLTGPGGGGVKAALRGLLEEKANLLV
jgi:hypothetical protein